MISSAVRATLLSCDLLSKEKKDMRETLSKYSFYYYHLLSAICNMLRFYSAILMIQYLLSFHVGRVSPTKMCCKIFSMRNTTEIRFQHFLRVKYIFVDKRSSFAQRKIKYSLHVLLKKFSNRMI